MNYSKQLRDELIQRAKTLVATKNLSAEKFYLSRGTTPVTLFKRHKEDGIEHHHNFCPASFEFILQRSNWVSRLQKQHSQRRAFFPADQTSAKELDSCCSSDALLMNIFCHPAAVTQSALARIFGFAAPPKIEFGFKPYLRFFNGFVEPRSSEIDLRLTAADRVVLAEAKLTETGFTTKAKVKVHRYADLATVFDKQLLPQSEVAYLHYQLIRNFLAAHHFAASFFLICDERRPDLQTAFRAVQSAVKTSAGVVASGIVTWQELSRDVPRDLRNFLGEKYGICRQSSVPS